MTKSLNCCCVILLVSCCFIYGRSSSEYIVNSTKCKIRNLDPFSGEVQHLSVPENYTSCTNLPLLSYVAKTDDNAFAEVRLRTELFPLYSKGEVNCCHSSVERNGSPDNPDVGVRFTTCTPFNLSVPVSDDPILITCEDDNLNVVYENVHAPIVIRNDIKRKFDQLEGKKPISVLFVVIDSISRLNLMRTMRNTRDYLLENGFVELTGYNKVDEDTFPNCMAFLTGFNLADAKTICNPQSLGKLDQCPMIWYDFRDLGYATAYAEDHPRIGTFNYQKKGFTDPPTDFYFKPYMEATEHLKVRYKDCMPYCTGPETSGERILNLAKDFAVTLKNRPYFGVFWMNTFSHNKLNSPYGMDHKVKQFFVDLKTEGVLNDSVVIFLSDHGIRFGDILRTRSGWFEERLPFHLISVPKWFQTEHPQEYGNFQNNAEKLTSTFDLYMTLQHILELSGLNYTTKPSKACPGCESLFRTIPQDRSCEEAGIPPKFCACTGRSVAAKPGKPLVQEIFTGVWQSVGNWFDNTLIDLCSKFL